MGLYRTREFGHRDMHTGRILSKDEGRDQGDVCTSQGAKGLQEASRR